MYYLVVNVPVGRLEQVKDSAPRAAAGQLFGPIPVGGLEQVKDCAPRAAAGQLISVK